ncbi:hypothetical protein GCM10009560_27760 [Nonomuraea longicatena]|uniref:Uncharacterized protein n=1 Tax=Nonomuraea longicatena TaxID=83682 RepID=A0ABN1PCX3_9ACTN
MGEVAQGEWAGDGFRELQFKGMCGTSASGAGVSPSASDEHGEVRLSLLLDDQIM